MTDYEERIMRQGLREGQYRGRMTDTYKEEPTPRVLDNFGAEIYEQNKAVGWWDDPNRCLITTVQLVSTEVAEATEGERKDLMDDHLPRRKMGEVELADALIRMLDIGAHLALTVGTDSNASALMLPSTKLILGRIDAGPAMRHFAINSQVVRFGEALVVSNERDAWLACQYSAAVWTIIIVSERLGYDIMGAAREKLIYNAQRADHKRENRNKPGGKGF